MILFEGMRTGDLKDIITNKITIDEYESKIDDSAVVITFELTDRFAANDANRFIQKSYVDILDSEVSASPNAEGNYIVFVELQNTPKAAKAIAEICYELQNIGSIEEWEISFRGVDGIFITPNEGVESAIKKHLKPFVHSVDTEIEVTENYKVEIGKKLKYNLVDSGSYHSVISRNKLQESVFDLSPKARIDCNRITFYLHECLVESIDGYIIISKGNKTLLLK